MLSCCVASPKRETFVVESESVVVVNPISN